MYCWRRVTWEGGPVWVFRLLDNSEQADFVAQGFLPNVGEFETEWTAIKRYMTRDATVEETIESCKSSRGALSYAHYAIAMDMLGTGQREVASHHFQKCRDAYFFYHYAYYWSRTFLERLKEDPTWPPWIPVRENDGAKNTTDPTNASRGDDS